MFKLVSSARFAGSKQLRQGFSFRSKRFYTAEEYGMITLEKKNNVALITLNRPKAYNALCNQLLVELVQALEIVDKDAQIGAVVLTGTGADIKEMAPQSFIDVYKIACDLSRSPLLLLYTGGMLRCLTGSRFALGGGCELAMTCDIILAGDSAKFGQPEITLGTIPGIGGTQRLARAVGKSRAMELILTGKQFDAMQAEQWGLVSRVVPDDKLLDDAMETAAKIASFSQPIVAMAKEAVNQAEELNLTQGVLFERRMFYSTFATNDRRDGMKAFMEKAKPNWTNS